MVNVSSGLSRPAMAEMSKEHRAAFEKPDLTVAEVCDSHKQRGRAGETYQMRVCQMVPLTHCRCLLLLLLLLAAA